MSGADFEGLLREAIGLDASSLGPTAVDRAVRRRQEVCRLPDRNAYWLHLRVSPSELQELVEAVVVPETWFFRDPQAFSALGAMAREDLLANPAKQGLRLLSLPCSTGEEPLSMAMALIDAGIDSSRFRIDGVDVSRRVIDLALQGSYGMNSFRGADLAFRQRHFDGGNGRWQPHADVRQPITFQQGNLFAADFLPGRATYDYIFCRNVLIYFDQPTQAQTLLVLLRLLAPRGCLFVGPSETGLLPREQLTSARLPMAFAFRHAAAGSTATAPSARRPETVRAARPSQRAATAQRRSGDLTSPRAASRSEPGVPARTVTDAKVQAASLSKLHDLANQGRLAEAATACEQHLREHGPSADALYLMGVIRDAAGQLDLAAAMYRKALYLQPEHAEALAHLSLLLDKQGKTGPARVLRERLQRIEAQVSR